MNPLLAPATLGPQTPVGDKYRVDHTYSPSDTFKTFRLHWIDADVVRFFVTRDGEERRVSAQDTRWDDARWKLVQNAPGCEKDVLIAKNSRVGVELGAYSVRTNYAPYQLARFFDDWKGKGLRIYWVDASNLSEQHDLVAAPTGHLGGRDILRNDDDSILGTIIPDGGSVGVILDPEYSSDEGLLPFLPDAWELPVGIFVGLLIGLLLRRRRRR